MAASAYSSPNSKHASSGKYTNFLDRFCSFTIIVLYHVDESIDVGQSTEIETLVDRPFCPNWPYDLRLMQSDSG